MNDFKNENCEHVVITYTIKGEVNKLVMFKENYKTVLEDLNSIEGSNIQISDSFEDVCKALSEQVKESQHLLDVEYSKNKKLLTISDLLSLKEKYKNKCTIFFYRIFGGGFGSVAMDFSDTDSIIYSIMKVESDDTFLGWVL